MDLYTLTKDFLPKEIIGEFVSAIWTERYSAAGDVQLVTPATPSMIKKLAPGTFLGLRGTKEIMVLDTKSVEDDLLTVSGQSLPKFLDERQAWFQNPDTSSTNFIGEYATTELTAGELISSVVNKMVINPVYFAGGYGTANLDWIKDKIPGLSLGRVDDNGEPKRMSIRPGPLYSAIQQLAEQEGVGIKLYLESSRASTGFVLKFATYRGMDRTSQQTDNTIVRLTPKMDSLTDVKELDSMSNYKNVVYVFYKNTISKHYAEPTLPIPEGFNRRILVVEADDIYLTADHVTPYREQTARDAFANHNYVIAVDGQVAPGIDYKFKEDYGLGDIIELEGLTGSLSKARITEYIRSQDKIGEREYPTLSVIDPLDTDFMPDVEPNDDFDDADEDPDFDEDEPLEPEDEDLDLDEDPNPDPEPDFDEEENGNGNGNGDGDGEPPTEDPSRVAANKVRVPPDRYFTQTFTRLKGIAAIGPPYIEYAGFQVSVHGSEQRLTGFTSKGIMGYVTYDPQAHSWLSMHSGAISGDKQNLEFRASPDGNNWTVLWNYLAPIGNFDSFKITLSDYFEIDGLFYESTKILPDHPDSQHIWSNPSISDKTKDDVPFVFEPGTLIFDPTATFTNGYPNGWWNYDFTTTMDSTFYVESWRANHENFDEVTELYIGIYDPPPLGDNPVQQALLDLEVDDHIRLRIPPKAPPHSDPDASFGVDLTYRVTGPTSLHEVRLGLPFNEGDYGPWVTVPVAVSDTFWDGEPVTYVKTSIHMPVHTF